MKRLRTKLTLQRETLIQFNADLERVFGGESAGTEPTDPQGPCCPALQAELRDARLGPRR